MIAHARIVSTLSLLLTMAAGCNDGGKSPDLARRAAAVTSQSTGSTPLRIVAVPDDVFGLSSRGEVGVLVDDPALQGARLFMDTGAGMVDTGVAPETGLAGQLTFGVAAPAGARLQVRGSRDGAPEVSNVVTVGARPATNAITILSPGGQLESVFPPPPVIAAPTETTWAAPLADRYLVILIRIDVINAGGATGKVYVPEQIVEVDGNTTRFAFGDAGLASYRAGSLVRGQLPVGTWGLVVCGLDASSWGFSTSTDVAGGDVFEFEVR